jgi:hypothetical protein
MAQSEPGVYRPSDDIRAFDGGEDRDLDEGGSRLPLLIVIALLVFFAFGGVVWLAYNQGVKHGRDDIPQIVASGRISAKTAHPVAATETPYKGLEIYRPPAKPESRTVDDNSIAGPPHEKPRPSVAAVTAPHSITPAKLGAAEASKKSPPMVTPKQAIQTPALKPPPRAAASADQIGSRAASTSATQSLKPAAQPPLPAQKQSVAQSKKPSVTASAPAITESKTTAAPPAKATGKFVLQIGSYKSEAEAAESWRIYKASHPAAAEFAPDIKRADLPGKGTWFRLRVGSFASAPEANALCAKLKRSGGACFPAKR